MTLKNTFVREAKPKVKGKDLTPKTPTKVKGGGGGPLGGLAESGRARGPADCAVDMSYSINNPYRRRIGRQGSWCRRCRMIGSTLTYVSSGAFRRQASSSISGACAS